MAVRFIQGGVMGLTSVSGNTITIDVIPSKRRGEGMGFLRIDDQSRHVFGSFGGGRAVRSAWFLLDHRGRFGDRVGRDRLRRADPLSETGESASSGLPRWIVLSWKKRFPAALAYLLVAIPYGMLLSFVVLYGKEIEVPNPGYFFICMAIGGRDARFDFRAVVGPCSKIRISCPSYPWLLLAISFSVFATVHIHHLSFSLARPAIGIGFGVSVPAFNASFRECRSRAPRPYRPVRPLLPT